MLIGSTESPRVHLEHEVCISHVSVSVNDRNLYMFEVYVYSNAT